MNNIYIYYKEKYSGALEYNLFSPLLEKSLMKLNQATNQIIDLDTIETLTGFEKDKVYYVICEILEKINNSQNDEYQSLNLDGISYTKKTTEQLNKEYKELYSILPQAWTRYI
jgi:hypothetical protein